MRKLFVILCLLMVLIPTYADDIPFEYFPEFKLEPITTNNVSQLELLNTWGRGTIHDSVWTPDGKYLRVASTLGVWQYDVSDWTTEPEFLMDSPMYLDRAVYGNSVYKFSPDGQTLFLSPEIITEHPQPFDNILAFNVMTGEILPYTPFQHETYAIYSPNRELAATYTEDGVSIWRNNPFAKRLDFFSSINLNKPVENLKPLSISNDGKQLAISAYNYEEEIRQIYLLDIDENGFLSLNTSWNNLVNLHFSADDNLIVLTGADDMWATGIINRNNHQMYDSTYLNNPPITIATSPTDRIAAFLDDHFILTIYELPNVDSVRFRTRLDTIPWDLDNIQLQFSPDGRYLLLVHDEGGLIWDTRTFALVHELDDFDYRDWYFWNEHHPSELRRVEDHWEAGTKVASRNTLISETIIRNFVTRPDDRDLENITEFVSHMDNGDVLLRGWVGYPLVKRVTFPEMETVYTFEASDVTDLEQHPTKPWLIMNGFHGVKIVDTQTYQPIEPWYPMTPCRSDAVDFKCHPLSSALDLSSDGQTLIFAQGVYGEPINVHLYRIGEEAVYATLSDIGLVYDVSFSLDDRWAIINGYSALHLWEVSEPDNIVTLKSREMVHDYDVSSMAFTDDSSMLVASTSYGIEFWEMESQELLHTLPRSDRQPMMMLDNVLVTYDRDVIRFWGVQANN